MQDDTPLAAQHQRNDLIKQKVSYRYLGNIRERPAANLRNIVRDNEVTAGWKAEQVAVVVAGKTYPWILLIYLFVSLDMPLMKPLNLSGRKWLGRQHAETAFCTQVGCRIEV